MSDIKVTVEKDGKTATYSGEFAVIGISRKERVMDEKWTMAGTFELTPELRDSLGLPDREYVVKDPVEIVVETKDGDRLKPPQEIRERIVRCRDCKNYRPAEDDEHEDGCALAYAYLFETSPDGFCAWGEEKGNE